MAFFPFSVGVWLHGHGHGHGHGLLSISVAFGRPKDDTPVGKDKFFNLVCCHLLCCLLGFGFVLFWLGIWDFEVFVEMRA